MNADDVITQLGDLLATTKVQPSLRPRRGTGASLYDVEYHVALISIAFRELAHAKHSGIRTIREPQLRLMQFVAARPHLLQPLSTWVTHRASSAQIRLDSWGALPRGYVTDRTHDATVEYLLALRALHRESNQLRPGDHFASLETVADGIEQMGTFEVERRTIKAILDLSVRGLG